MVALKQFNSDSSAPVSKAASSSAIVTGRDAAKSRICAFAPVGESVWVWTQLTRPLGVGGLQVLENLVGPPGFEPGTSCTPSNLNQSLAENGH